VDHVNGNPDRHRFAVPKFELRELLQLVGRPMPKIQGPGGSELEGITGGGDMIEMQLGTAIDEPFHGGAVESAQTIRILFESGEEIGVANERDFNGFHITRSLIARS